MPFNNKKQARKGLRRKGVALATSLNRKRVLSKKRFVLRCAPANKISTRGSFSSSSSARAWAGKRCPPVPPTANTMTPKQLEESVFDCVGFPSEFSSSLAPCLSAMFASSGHEFWEASLSNSRFFKLFRFNISHSL